MDVIVVVAEPEGVESRIGAGFRGVVDSSVLVGDEGIKGPFAAEVLVADCDIDQLWVFPPESCCDLSQAVFDLDGVSGAVGEGDLDPVCEIMGMDDGVLPGIGENHTGGHSKQEKSKFFHWCVLLSEKSVRANLLT